MSEENIIIIDLKAFYASVECADRRLNPLYTPLIVVDKTRGPGTIILSVTPFLKNRGIPSRLRLYELPKGEYIYAMPRMERYLQMSAEVLAIILNYVNEDDIHIYSIDELFLDVSHYLKMYNSDAKSIAKMILNDIEQKLHLIACAGIGPNLFLAKCALDLEAKSATERIAIWTYNDVKTKLYKISPLSKMWGISSRLEKKLNALGIFTVQDLAFCPLTLLIEKFGIIGEELHNHANGIDESNIREKYLPNDTSLSVGQVLNRDFSISELPILLHEMCDELMLRLRLQRKFCSTVHLSIMYSKNVKNKGFSSQIRLIYSTDDEEVIYQTILEILNANALDLPIRKITISISGLRYPSAEQLNLFSSNEDVLKRRSLQETIDKIRQKYGKNAILRADALTKSSNIIERHKLIGGHRR